MISHFLYFLPNLSPKSPTKDIAAIKGTGLAMAIEVIIDPAIIMLGVADLFLLGLFILTKLTFN